MALDRLSLNANQNLARAHYFARRLAQVIEASRTTLEIDPNFAIAHARTNAVVCVRQCLSIL
jgi:mannitol/fructose-specific phosphotransferase system IIA component (Ntr-type)